MWGYTFPAQGGDLVPTMPGCVCLKVKDMGPFRLQVSEISENKSYKMDVKIDTLLNMGENLFLLNIGESPV